jgi:CBS domain-containing protein
MTVQDILKAKGRDVFTIHVEATVGDALKVLAEKKIGGLIVVDDRENIRGIVTERDIVRSCHDSQRNVKSLAVQDIMTARDKLIVGNPADEIDYVMNVITQKRIRHIPIVDSKGTLCGIVSVGDIVKAMLTHKDHEIKYLRDYIESKYPV